ncbi:MAG: hypothetical protein ACXVFX_15000 [Blastococcus sp.]
MTVVSEEDNRHDSNSNSDNDDADQRPDQGPHQAPVAAQLMPGELGRIAVKDRLRVDPPLGIGSLHHWVMVVSADTGGKRAAVLQPGRGTQIAMAAAPGLLAAE